MDAAKKSNFFAASLIDDRKIFMCENASSILPVVEPDKQSNRKKIKCNRNFYILYFVIIAKYYKAYQTKKKPIILNCQHLTS